MFLGFIVGILKNRRLKMKIEDSRKKPQDRRCVGWLGWVISLKNPAYLMLKFWYGYSALQNLLGSSLRSMKALYRRGEAAVSTSGLSYWHLVCVLEGWFGLTTSYVFKPYVENTCFRRVW